MSDEIMNNAAEDFKRILSLKVDQTVPTELLKAYMRYKKMKDVASAGPVSISEVILLATINGYPKDNEDLQQGDRVKTVFKGAEVHGEFIETTGFPEKDRCHVKLDGDKMKFREVLLADTIKE